MKLSIIIPAYNERHTIGQVLASLDALDFGFDVEFIVSDDGSTDGTANIIKDLRTTRPLKKHLAAINQGKGAAIRAGLGLVEGDHVIIQDADLENDPADILRLAQESQRTGAQAVYGTRFAAGSRQLGKASPANLAANRVMTAYANLLFGARLTDMATAYKLIQTSVIKKIRLQSLGFDFEPEITAKLLRMGCKIHEVPISYLPRSKAQGKKVRWTDGLRYMLVLTRFRLVPLESFILAG